MAHEKYQKIHKQRLHLLSSSKAIFSHSLEEKAKSFEEIVNTQLGSNKFFTLYNMQSGVFVNWHLVHELIGYVNSEFTIEAINNVGELKIIHEEDIEHKLRYDNIIYNLLKSENSFEVRKDSYCVSMRIINKNRDIVSVRRRCYIFETKYGRPFTQFDEWEINNRYKSSHVFPELILSSLELQNKITSEFYLMNLQYLGLSFGSSSLRVLHYKVKGESNDSISRRLNISPQVVANMHSHNFDILKDRFVPEIDEITEAFASKEKRENINVFREVCRRYGLYPVPESILKIDPYKKKK